MRLDKIKSQEELIAKALADSSRNVAIANERVKHYQSIKKRENEKMCVLEWTNQYRSLRKKIRSLESQVKAWSQNTRLGINLSLELHDETRRGEEEVDPIRLEEQIVAIRKRISLEKEKVSPPLTIIHSLQQLKKDLGPILRIDSSLMSLFEEERIQILQKSNTKDKVPIKMAQKRIKDLSVQIVNSFMKDIRNTVENQIKEEINFRSLAITKLKSITDDSAKDEMIFKQCVLKSKQDELELLQRIERLATDQKIQNYKCQKRFETDEAFKERQSFEESERQKRIEEMYEAKQRVEHRYMLIELRKHQRKEKDERDRFNEESKTTKLKKLATHVPYFEAITNKKSDIHKLTKARLNDVYQYRSESDLLAFQQGDRKMTSFTSEKIFSDPKFRLAQQLHEKGIASSKYSLAVVKNLIPRKTERTTGIEPY